MAACEQRRTEARELDKKKLRKGIELRSLAAEKSIP